MLEVAIERDFRRYCTQRHQQVLCIKLIAAGDNGYPDRMVIGWGFNFFIEFKRPNCYPSSLQKHIHEKLRFLGQGVYCFNTAGAAEETLDNYMTGLVPHLVVRENGITDIKGKIYRGI